MTNSYNSGILFSVFKFVKTIFAICSNIMPEIKVVWQPRQHFWKKNRKRMCYDEQ